MTLVKVPSSIKTEGFRPLTITGQYHLSEQLSVGKLKLEIRVSNSIVYLRQEEGADLFVRG